MSLKIDNMPRGIYFRTKPVWNKGKRYPQVCGIKNIMWKGDNVGYDALHDWVNRWLNIPKKCSKCGVKSKKDSIGRRTVHWANKSHKYKRILKDWIALCIKCHRRYDNHPFVTHGQRT